MKVTLYRYVGDSDTANKILKNCTVVYDKEVIPYGAFNPNGASFRLDTLHDVNYAKFTYNSHDYYGYVDVNTDSKGIYNYTITTDPLTTAWYAGCFNVGNVCAYSDYGTLQIKDRRLSYDEPVVYTIKPTEVSTIQTAYNSWYVITVLTPQPTNEVTHTNNPSFQSYAIKDRDYTAFSQGFRQQFTEAEQGKYSPSIVGIYMIRAYEAGTYFSRFQTTTKIDLWSMSSTPKGDFTSIDTKSVDLHGTGGYPDAGAYRVDILADGQTTDWCVRYDMPITPISLTPENMDMQYTFFIPDCGSIYFTLSGIWNYLTAPSGKAKALYSIGYKKYFDFVSGTYKLYLCLNNSEGVQATIKEYCLTGPIGLRTPWMYDSSINDWRSTMLSLITSGINSGIRLAGLSGQLISSISSTDGNKVTPIAMLGRRNGAGAGRVTNATSTIAQQAGDAGFGISLQMASESVNTVGGAVNNYMHQIWQEENAAAATTGGAGGSPDFIMLPWVIAKYHKSHNLADIQGKFGKPDGLVRVVGQLKGWVQTEACHLPSNGLAFNIVTQAEQLSDQGFRIVT